MGGQRPRQERMGRYVPQINPDPHVYFLLLFQSYFLRSNHVMAWYYRRHRNTAILRGGSPAPKRYQPLEAVEVALWVDLDSSTQFAQLLTTVPVGKLSLGASCGWCLCSGLYLVTEFG